MDDFGQIAIEQAERAANVDDVNRHVKTVQNEYAGVE
jgi:hypothetical protein